MLHSMKYLSGSHAASGIIVSSMAVLLEQSSQHQQEVYTVSSINIEGSGRKIDRLERLVSSSKFWKDSRKGS